MPWTLRFPKRGRSSAAARHQRGGRRRPLRLAMEQLETRTMLAESSGLFNDSVLMRTDRRSVPVPTFNSGYTYEAWVRRADAGRCETVLSSGYDIFNVSQGFWFGLCNGGFVSLQSNTGTSPLHSGSTFIPANVWTHIAATWSLFEERIYVNGELDGVFTAGAEPNRGQNNLYVGSWRNENFLFGGTSHFFLGHISEARVWQTVRTQDQIRRSMHELMEGRPPDLLATWHMRTDFAESVNNFPTTNSNPCICGPVAPPVFRVSEVDQYFNRLPAGRFVGAVASVPATNQAYLIGGYTGASPYQRRSEIMAMDMATGNVTTVANLPFAMGSQTAAYAPTNNSIYVFGGELGLVPQNTIVKYDLTTNTVTQLAATLPAAHWFGNAVWHPGIQRIVVVGGYGANPDALDTLVLFDPATETATLAAVRLPSPRYNSAVAYSPLTDRLYVFGGNDNLGFTNATRTTIEITIHADGSGAASFLAGGELPLAHTFAAAVEDPDTHLIHILGGTAEYVQTFDPRTGKSWRTMIRMPRSYINGNRDGAVLNTPYQMVVHSPRNRHALVIGGGNYGGAAVDKVWRVPLGDGPAVPIERWDFINSLPTLGTDITEIDGDDRGVYFASRNDGGDNVIGLDENRTSFLYDPPGFNGSVEDIAFNPTRGLFVAFGNSSVGGAWQFFNGTATQYTAASMGATGVYSIQPDYTYFGSDQGVKNLNIFGNWQTAMNQPATSFDYVVAQAGRGTETWAIVRDKPIVTFESAGPWRLGHVVRPIFGGATIGETPSVCGDDIFHAPGGLSRYYDITQDNIGNLWIVGWGRGPEAVCFLPRASLAGTPSGGLVTSVLGNRAEAVDADGDNRVWVAVQASDLKSGGLTVYEVNATGPLSGQLRNSDYNWLTAPIGSRREFNGTWDSSIVTVAAVDEKVYAAKGFTGAANGGIATVSQRWQQLDEFLANQVVHGVYTVAGRTFFNLGYGLYELKPDGLTYEFRSRPEELGIFGQTRVVAGDGAGRIWVGTSNGPYLYTPTGWDDMSDRIGARPASETYAIVEEVDDAPLDGRAAPVWIGGDSGLTLFDRNRFVHTFTTANSPLPANTVKTLLVDSANNLWVGTTAGLARLAPDRMTWTTFTTANGLPHNAIFDLAQLGNGQIAVSTAGGLSLFNGMTFTAQSPPVAAVNLPLSIDSQGQLWAGSAVLTGSGWQGYWWTNSGLKHSTISDTATDGADRIWFSHAPNPGVSVRGTYLPPLKDITPVITGYSPNQGSAGTVVTINGLSLGSSATEPSLEVTVGGSKARILTASETEVRVELTETTTSGQVSLTRAGKRTSSTIPFCAVPQLRGGGAFSPTGGSAGMEIDIYGTNFDPDARVRFGNGPARSVSGSPTNIKRIVEVDDPTGGIVVQNHCAGATATSGLSFRKIDVSIPTTLFNQGMPSDGVVEDKATLFQTYVSAGGPLGLGEKVEVDEVRHWITDRNGATRQFNTTLPATGINPPLVDGPPTNAQRMTIASSVNVPAMYFTESGQNTVRTELLRRGRRVAEGTTTVGAAPNSVLQVLLVPIMWNTADGVALQTLKTNVDGDLRHVKERMFPGGTANVVWSDDVIRRDETFTLDNFFNLYYAAPGLDRIRRRHNEKPNTPDAQIVMGVVQPSLASGGSAPGFAFGADISKLLNTLVLDELDSLCDGLNGVVNTLSFGLLGSDDGCHLDIPLYVGWMTGPAADNAGVSPGQTLAHEIGHTLGLVKPWAGNGSWTDNVSHSVNDELPATVECNDTGGMPTDIVLDKVFDRQPGVTRPIVDPIGGTEFLPATNDRNPNNALRAKAMMSYACNTNANNTFFEPVDIGQMNHPLVPLVADMIKLARLLSDDGSPPAPSPAAATAAQRAAASPAAPRRPAAGNGELPPDTSGPRLHVFGTLDSNAAAGEIARVESYGETAPLSPSFNTGYWIVQLDGAGNELARTGVAPLSASEFAPGTATQFVFSATLRRLASTARLELRQGDTVLDVFAPGGATPQVQIVQPAIGGFYHFGPVHVEWTATDADGDPLEVAVEYSPDGGLTWNPVGSGTGSGSLGVPIESLAMRNGGPGHFRVTASDGFRSASAVSAAFAVANQPPQVTIDRTLNFGTVLEGRPVSLAATALDPEDGPLDGASLRWDSSLDGTIGSGARLTTAGLSVGFHAISVYAFDGAGAVNSSTIYLTVAGDYDFDGIDDASEAASTLNPLTSSDAFSDADADGLTLLVERQIGSNPTSIDSDGDGRSDDQEFVDGTDSMTIDSPPAPDALTASLTDLSLTIDLAAGTPLPQFNISVNSRHPADWQLITDVDWLEATATTGTTPGSTLVRVQAYKLTDGVHVARLQFDSGMIGDSAIMPITVTVVNQEAYYDADGSGTSDDADCDAVQALLGLTVDDPGYDLAYDVDRNGVIDTADVGVCDTTVGTPSLPGDFDFDGDQDDHDIDLFIVNPFIDFNNDSNFDAADVTYLIENIFHTHYGDANLDGFVSGADAAIVASNLGWSGGAAWARGNFNGDPRVDLVDLSLLQRYLGQGPAPSPAASPAPAASVTKTESLSSVEATHRQPAAQRSAVAIRADRRLSAATIDAVFDAPQSAVSSPATLRARRAASPRQRASESGAPRLPR